MTSPGRAGVTSISGLQVDSDPFAIAKGDLIKCLLQRDSVVATHLFSVERIVPLVAENMAFKKRASDRSK